MVPEKKTLGECRSHVQGLDAPSVFLRAISILEKNFTLISVHQFKQPEGLGRTQVQIPHPRGASNQLLSIPLRYLRMSQGVIKGVLLRIRCLHRFWTIQSDYHLESTCVGASSVHCSNSLVTTTSRWFRTLNKGD